MKKTKKLLTVLFLVIISTIIAGCGDDSTPTTPGALSVTTASPLPAATIGTPYNQTLTPSGGTAPYTWTLATGSAALPAWLTLSTSGTLSGTPPTGAVAANFTVMVTDSATPAGTATKAFSIPVGSAPPVFNALTFYDTSCINTGAGCHPTLGGRSAGQITTAIANIGAMSSFRAGGTNPLTPAQINAIAAVSH
jgi:large repetitive protein